MLIVVRNKVVGNKPSSKSVNGNGGGQSEELPECKLERCRGVGYVAHRRLGLKSYQSIGKRSKSKTRERDQRNNQREQSKKTTNSSLNVSSPNAVPGSTANDTRAASGELPIASQIASRHAMLLKYARQINAVHGTFLLRTATIGPTTNKLSPSIIATENEAMSVSLWCFVMSFPYELPMRIPVKNTRKPPTITWKRAEVRGVSMKRWRIQEITPSSTITIPAAIPVAVRYSGIR